MKNFNVSVNVLENISLFENTYQLGNKWLQFPHFDENIMINIYYTLSLLHLLSTDGLTLTRRGIKFESLYVFPQLSVNYEISLMVVHNLIQKFHGIS